MKRITVLLSLCLILSVAFFACNNSSIDAPQTDKNESVTEEVSDFPTTEVEISEAETDTPGSEAATTEKSDETQEETTTEFVSTEVTTEEVTTSAVTSEAETTPPSGGGSVPPSGGGTVTPSTPPTPPVENCDNGHNLCGCRCKLVEHTGGFRQLCDRNGHKANHNRVGHKHKNEVGDG